MADIADRDHNCRNIIIAVSHDPTEAKHSCGEIGVGKVPKKSLDGGLSQVRDAFAGAS